MKSLKLLIISIVISLTVSKKVLVWGTYKVELFIYENGNKGDPFIGNLSINSEKQTNIHRCEIECEFEY